MEKKNTSGKEKKKQRKRNVGVKNNAKKTGMKMEKKKCEKISTAEKEKKNVKKNDVERKKNHM